MKTNYPAKRLLYLLVFFVFVSTFHTRAQTTCDFEIVAKIDPCYCLKDGKITVSLKGDDVEDGFIEQPKFLVLPEGEDDNNLLDKTVFDNLSPGKYTIKASAICLRDNQTIRKQITVEIPWSGDPWETPDFQVVASRKTFNCRPTGKLSIEALTGGKAPFKIEFTAWPSGFDTSKRIIYEGNNLNPSYPIEDLPAGNYTIRFSDGCEGYKEINTSIEKLSSDFYTGAAGTLFNNYAYPINIIYASRDASDCNTIVFQKSSNANSNRIAWGEWYDYLQNWEEYYEYAFIKNGQVPSESDWKSFSGDYINYHSDIPISLVNTSDLPTIAFRVKGGSCPATYGGNYTVSVSRSTSFTTQSVALEECGIYTYRFYYTGSYLICYPITVTATASDGVTTYTNEPVAYNAGGNIKGLPADTYTIKMTDGSGTTIINRNYTISDNSSVNSLTTGYGSRSQCLEEVAPYISHSVSPDFLNGMTITFDRDRTHASIPTPTHPVIKVTPENHTGSIYPWGDDDTKFSTSTNAYVKTYSNARAYFIVEDSCGNVNNTFYITLPSPRRVENEPTYIKENVCGGLKITPTNLADVYKTYNTETGVVSNSGNEHYMMVTDMPEGASVVYSYSGGYCRSSYPEDYMILTKSGKYKFTVSMSYPNATNTYTCGNSWEIEVEVKEFELNEEVTAAYRCQGIPVGKGYIKVEATGGSGNYWYTLYDYDQATKLSENGTGEFPTTDWTSTSGVDTYYILIEDTDPDCKTSLWYPINLYDLANASLIWTDYPVYCPGDNVTLRAVSLGEDDLYTWTGPNGFSATGKNITINNLNASKVGTYTVYISIPGCGTGASVTYSFDLEMADTEMYWRTDAINNDWHDKANWITRNGQAARAVPSYCTTVHIPGQSSFYPNLNMDYTPREVYGFPRCDTIIYHYGAETAFPHYLKYNRAKVQYNNGYYGQNLGLWQPTNNWDREVYPNANLAPGTDWAFIQRAQYYAVAAPLKKMTSGDFTLAGYPHVYYSLFNTTNPETNALIEDGYTGSFNNMAVDLSTTGHALAIWLPDYDVNYVGQKDHKNLEGLKGVMEMPYFLDDDILTYRPLHTYSKADSTSHFQYYNRYTLLPEPNMYDTFERGYKAYRFVFENDNDTLDIQNVMGEEVAVYNMLIPTPLDGVRMMIGNPLMCHLDFDKIYENNSQIIENSYQISIGSSSQYKTYTVGAPSSTNDIGKYIPPLQGFIIKMKQGALSNQLILPLEGSNSVIGFTTTGESLGKPGMYNISSRQRAESMDSQKWINLYAITPPKVEGSVSTTDSIRIRATLYFNTDEDFRLQKAIFDEDMQYKAEIFFIDKQSYFNEKQIENGMSYSIPIGIYSLYEGEIVFQLSKSGNFVENMELEDIVTGKKYTITDNIGYYRFTHRYTNVENNKKGMDTQRFRLILKYNESVMDINPDLACTLKAYITNNILKITSPGIIEKYEIVDMTGNLIYQQNNINSYEVNHMLSITPGAYLLKVQEQNEKIKALKIMIQ